MAPGPQTSRGNLARRVGFAVVAIPVALLLVWYGGWPLALLLSVAGALGARELFDLAERGQVRPARVIGLASAAAIAPITYASLASPDVGTVVAAAWPYVTALWLVVVLGWALLRRAPAERPLEAVAVTLFAVVYPAGLPAFLLAIRHGGFERQSWAGTWLVFFPLVVTWVVDTAAMFGGRAIGGAKLVPTISPGKTRSGSLAGLAGGLVVAPVFAAAVFPAAGLDIPVWQLLVIAAVLGVIGQVGDLAESLFKREAGVKDSSHLIPGHGGVLDRLDSLYFVVPVAAAMYRAFGIIR
ncbi:MAG TPA: phosphatidate cytidylyltransferase [Gemmatimonadales bacterium]|nr:phosphatidate cytidylyltransferase [Gemmatimonadales bacterium]